MGFQRWEGTALLLGPWSGSSTTRGVLRLLTDEGPGTRRAETGSEASFSALASQQQTNTGGEASCRIMEVPEDRQLAYSCPESLGRGT